MLNETTDNRKRKTMKNTFVFNARKFEPDSDEQGKNVTVTLTEEEFTALFELLLEQNVYEPKTRVDRVIDFLDACFPWAVIIGGCYLFWKMATYVWGVIF